MFPLAIVLSVLRFTDSDDSFGIFKIFLKMIYDIERLFLNNIKFISTKVNRNDKESDIYNTERNKRKF